VVLARRNGATVGCCCLSDRPVYVPELQRRLDFDGAYLWRLYVDPEMRGRGVWSAIVARAVRASAGAFDADRTVALVAPDNLPSRKAFRNVGFRATERFTSGGVRGREFHRRSALDA
jgi:RimJ/RimL family protein N-acetyltransferase